MQLINKSNEEIKNEIYTIISEETGLTDFNQESIIKGIADTLVQLVSFTYSVINELYKNISLDEASGMYLDLEGFKCDTPRRLATKTKRYVDITTNSKGKIDKGTWITVTGTDLRYKVVKDYNFNKNQNLQIEVEAEFEGSKYNIDSSFEIRFTKIIDGIESLTLSNIIEIGLDEESDDSLRTRIKQKWASLTEANIKARYVNEVLQIQGVEDCQIVRTPRGGGSIDIVVSIFDGFDIDNIIYEIEQRLENKEIICRDMLIREANKYLVDISITYSTDDNNITDQIVSQYIYSFINKLKIGQTLFITGSKGLYNYLTEELNFTKLIISPFSDIEITKYQIIEIGNLTIQRI